MFRSKNSGGVLARLLKEMGSVATMITHLVERDLEYEDAGLRILAIDDDPQALELIRNSLPQQGVKIEATRDPNHGLELFRQLRPQVVLLGVVMPGASGMDMLEQVLAIDPGAEVILIDGRYSPECALEALRNGAADYLTKPFNVNALRARIQNMLAERAERKRTLQLEHELVEVFQFSGVVGRSPLMLDVFASIRRVAPHFRTVLVTGDTGTGKELVASALHRLSPVSSNTYAICNCSALVETLFESELFGYVRGAFTGASHDKVGLFEYANGGTVFLDEIGDMPLAAQAKLLRVLQNQELQRVGSPVSRKLDVRVIAASNRNLRAMVQEQKFRADLYYRLSMIEIRLPRLQDRKEDLPLLQRYFVEKFSALYKKPVRGITQRAQVALAKYHWPGNVRELENVIGNACMMADGPVIDVKHLPPHIYAPDPHSASDPEPELISMEEVQRRHLLRVLQKVGGDKTRAAEILGIGRATVYNMLGRIRAEEARRLS
jgi:DNA-binding NtrC family response regulator